MISNNLSPAVHREEFLSTAVSLPAQESTSASCVVIFRGSGVGPEKDADVVKGKSLLPSGSALGHLAMRYPKSEAVRCYLSRIAANILFNIDSLNKAWHHYTLRSAKSSTSFPPS
jgi:hypothetical protein